MLWRIRISKSKGDEVDAHCGKNLEEFDESDERKVDRRGALDCSTTFNFFYLMVFWFNKWEMRF